MPQRADTFELGRLGLASGEGRTLELGVAIEPFSLGGAAYEIEEALVPVRLDVSRTTGPGYALRLRYAATLSGACMRCLGPAAPAFEVDAREVDIAGGGDELSSPYVGESEELDLARWARDALALALPAKIVCSAGCRGLCPHCGADLNEDPGHAHEPAPDPRWAKLSEIRFEQ